MSVLRHLLFIDMVLGAGGGLWFLKAGRKWRLDCFSVNVRPALPVNKEQDDNTVCDVTFL